jgi:hypothetical protein
MKRRSPLSKSQNTLEKLQDGRIKYVCKHKSEPCNVAAKGESSKAPMRSLLRSA